MKKLIVLLAAILCLGTCCTAEAWGEEAYREDEPEQAAGKAEGEGEEGESPYTPAFNKLLDGIQDVIDKVQTGKKEVTPEQKAIVEKKQQHEDTLKAVSDMHTQHLQQRDAHIGKKQGERKGKVKSQPRKKYYTRPD